MKLVAIGGGHGTAVVVEAATQLDAEVTAIVSVADDGGSSGKLRTAFDIPAVGDVRRCIGSACLPTVRDYLERRVGFDGDPRVLWRRPYAHADDAALDWRGLWRRISDVLVL